MREKPGASNQSSVRFVRSLLTALVFIAHLAAQIATESSPAAAWNNRAIQLAKSGQQDEAEAEYRAALDASHDDLTRARIASNLADLYRREDRFHDAEQAYRSALQWRQQNLPAGSAEVAYSLNNLGEIYRIEGRDWEARNLIGTAARNLQDFHPDARGLPIVLSNFGVMLGRFGEFDLAAETLRSALIGFEKLHENSSREYGVTLANLADVLGTRTPGITKDLGDAASLYDQAIGILEKLGSPATAELASALAGRGELYRRLDELDRARQTEERALDLLPPAGHALIRARILRCLGNIVADGTQPAASVRYFEQSLDIQEKTLGAAHPATATLLLDYASATQRAGNRSLSRKLRKRAQDLLTRLRTQSLSQMTVSLRDLRDNK